MAAGALFRAMNIYVIGARRYIKIGISRDVKARLSTIQTGCPYPLHVYQSWATSRAREIERKAHSLLHGYRTKGEWFDLPHRAATLIVGMLVSAHPARNGFPDSTIEKAVVFCRGCSHQAVIPFIPDSKARFCCSKCHSTERVHMVRMMFNLMAKKA